MITWFIELLFTGIILNIMGGLADAWMYRNRADFDGIGVDLPDWLGNLSQVFWLGGQALKYALLPVFGFFANELNISLIDTVSMILLVIGGTSLLWDMAYSYMKTRTFTKSLKYWILVKKTKYIPYIRIGWESKGAVIFSYLLRASFVVLAYYIPTITTFIKGLF